MMQNEMTLKRVIYYIEPFDKDGSPWRDTMSPLRPCVTCAWTDGDAWWASCACTVKALTTVELLIVDELGYVPFAELGGELLFEVLGQRYKRSSMPVASNLPFDERTSLLDRIPSTHPELRQQIPTRFATPPPNLSCGCCSHRRRGWEAAQFLSYALW